MNDTAPGIGHNVSPAAYADGIAELTKRTNDLIENCNLWLKAVTRQEGEKTVREIANEEQAARVKDFRDQVRKELAAVEKKRKATKQPHLDAAAAVDTAFNPLKTPLSVIDGILEPLERVWLQKDKERKDAERIQAAKVAAEAQRAAEEAKRAAESAGTVQAVVAAKAAEERAAEAQKNLNGALRARPQIHGELSGRRARGLREFWSAKIVDYFKALQAYKDDPAVRDAVQTAADKEARSRQAAMNTDEEIARTGVKAVSEEESV